VFLLLSLLLLLLVAGGMLHGRLQQLQQLLLAEVLVCVLQQTIQRARLCCQLCQVCLHVREYTLTELRQLQLVCQSQPPQGKAGLVGVQGVGCSSRAEQCVLQQGLGDNGHVVLVCQQEALLQEGLQHSDDARKGSGKPVEPCNIIGVTCKARLSKAGHVVCVCGVRMPRWLDT